MIDRPIYLNRLVSFQDKSMIKIVTGMRRCGKSSLLLLFIDHLKASGIPQERIIHMNFESFRHRDIVDDAALYRAIESRIVSGEKTYLVLDEVQMVNRWARAVDSFLVDFDVDIYLTGSNAYMLSSEFSTMLSGRYVEIRMLPLSFREFLTFHAFDATVSVDERFQRYLQYGGMPAVAEFGFDEPRIHDMLDGILSTVILKDVLERNRISDQPLLRKITTFLADSVGSLVSPNRIGNTLVDEGDLAGNRPGRNPASRTVENYIEMLCSAFIFYKAGRYDIKGRQLLKTLGKYYIVDMGLRNMLLGYRDVDRGHVLENIVYFELLRRDYRVSIGKIDEREVDFVAERPDHKMYIQVPESLTGEKTRERELAPLRDIPDHHMKLVLSMDRSFVLSQDGIRLQHVVDFLLEE